MNYDKYETLSVSIIDEYILILSLNRVSFCNAINLQMITELRDFWLRVDNESDDIRIIVLTGEGNKAFCAGADLKERYDMDTETWKKQHLILSQSFKLMIDCQIPIITAVNGAAIGGGMELVLASDFSYATPRSTFSLPEVKWGIIPGAMGTQLLPRACGIKRAKELCFTGNSFSAKEALQWGIINKICSPEKLMNEVLLTANQIVQNAPLSIRQVKKSLQISQNTDIHSGFSFEIESYAQLIDTEDRKKRIRSFVENSNSKSDAKLTVKDVDLERNVTSK